MQAINCALEHARLFGGETKEEQIEAMKEYALSSSGSTKEASDIVQNMLDRFSTEYQTRNNPSIAGPAPTTEHKDDSSSTSRTDDTSQNNSSTNKIGESNCIAHDFFHYYF